MQMRIGKLGVAGIVAVVLSLAAPAVAFDTPDSGGDSGQSSDSGKPAANGPTLKQARADIDAKKWNDAIVVLKAIVAAQPNNADAYNLLGYSYRHAGDTKKAQAAYVRALKIDPNHTGALEYQGELYVQLGQIDKAKANLAKIKGLCGTTCEEYEDLDKAIGS
jgi:cytochrome c-type biogenesis protein CcmH/NrfG